MLLPSPQQLKQILPNRQAPFIAAKRREAAFVLERREARLALLVGPCSIHDPEVALDYAEKLHKLKLENFFIVMRFFIEKPRTRLGWKGILYDPHLDGSNDIEAGLYLSRQTLLEITELGLPVATELLEPLATPYFDDLLTWGIVGARTSASQTHRQLASGLSFPVGFKNDLRGKIDAAIAAIASSRAPHSHLGLNEEGRIAAVQTAGNPLTHLVLRGSDRATNYDSLSVASALEELQKEGLAPRLIIDCSHGNSRKDPKRQKGVFQAVLEQVLEGNEAIAGLMLESHLFEGNQRLGSRLHYGVSITDACLGWEETASLLLSADAQLSRPMSIRSVQKWCSHVSKTSFD